MKVVCFSYISLEHYAHTDIGAEGSNTEVKSLNSHLKTMAM